MIDLPLKYSPSSTRDNVSISERLCVISRIRSSSERIIFKKRRTISEEHLPARINSNFVDLSASKRR